MPLSRPGPTRMIPWFAVLVVMIALSHAAPARAAGAAKPTPAPVRFKAGPCDAPECHQFDFWIGDWDVFTSDGQLAGTNKVERILGGCVLTENWEGSKGSQGRSFNMYSAVDKQWRQTWVDNQGSRLDLAGTFDDGKMVMTGDTTTPGGAPLHNRITWQPLPDGQVKQHWEVSPDGEKWSDAFLGFYTRHNADGKGASK